MLKQQNCSLAFGRCAKFRMKSLLALLIGPFLVLLIGCAAPHVMLERVVVLNATASKITEVRVFHEPTRKSGKVNAILPQMTLDIGFSKAPMLARQATVSWRDGAGTKHAVRLELPYDRAAARDGRTTNLVYVIQPSGVARMHFE